MVARGRVSASDAARRRIEERIPDGYELQVQPVPAWWLFYLLHGGGRAFPGPVRVSRGLPLEQAAAVALDRWDRRIAERLTTETAP